MRELDNMYNHWVGKIKKAEDDEILNPPKKKNQRKGGDMYVGEPSYDGEHQQLYQPASKRIQEDVTTIPPMDFVREVGEKIINYMDSKGYKLQNTAPLDDNGMSFSFDSGVRDVLLLEIKNIDGTIYAELKHMDNGFVQGEPKKTEVKSTILVNVVKNIGRDLLKSLPTNKQVVPTESWNHPFRHILEGDNKLDPDEAAYMRFLATGDIFNDS